MTYYNNGSICFKAEELEEVLKLLAKNTRLNLSKSDAYMSQGQQCLEIASVVGNLEQELEDFCEDCKKNGIKIELDVTYSGDAEGRYVYENGAFHTLGASEVCLMEASDEELLAEIYRRGLAQKIHDDVVRAFMASELEQEYGLSSDDAKEYANDAYDYYVETEGASQYDGIEHAAEEYERDRSKINEHCTVAEEES